MRSESAEALWLNEHGEVTLHELAVLAAVPESLLLQLVERGVLVPARAEAAEWSGWTCSARWVVTVRRAQRLMADFELDAGTGESAFPLLLSLLERMRSLEEDIERLSAGLPRRPV